MIKAPTIAPPNVPGTGTPLVAACEITAGECFGNTMSGSQQCLVFGNNAALERLLPGARRQRASECFLLNQSWTDSNWRAQ